MARMKEGLKSIFKDCTTYQEVFAKMPEAKRAGFSNEEINTAVSQINKNIKSRSAHAYRHIPTTLYDINKVSYIAVLPVTLTGNTDTNIIRFKNNVFEV